MSPNRLLLSFLFIFHFSFFHFFVTRERFELKNF
ncbi:hypothetical protein NC652_025387 [Populus alba x Populus x berolinensis]|nr:hypothetical protein NC652_025387 [Populus alba x Populus x berolinensis]